ncbi:heat-inducible transcriptional repressor HrcA [Pseudobacteroides cellulosolvens]|uniref:Heat-inducible transcription repressor HrcA n=1 Tax=Pseudobacteroides cellulosolvens ATCC 35603 = DSM 2933 TaxID=398512 RepID=A0A0L6JLU8_9FIRM|nr:heat-inducible transcriptional repressor HrcA [Pseudobacteroides cellulosolvens]KNY26796.1 heat-inducible transcription repressor HrcA [Pseudobacteroides cellulosolvens ATCC 35603 = DSM 2933]
MYLDDRKRRILQAIIDDYIDTAEPIGSRTIARKHELGLSSATIRNEMADLEEMGFLGQPHTSAGRVPSDKGYRLYVNELMKERVISTEEADCIKQALEVRINEMNQLIRQASMIMSKITKYTSIAIAPQLKKSILKAVQVVPIQPGRALVIVVTSANVVRNSFIKIQDNVTADLLIMLSNVLNIKLNGLTIDQIGNNILLDIEKELGITKEILIPIIDGIVDSINNIDYSDVYLEGTTNILNFPEFMDIVKAKEFLNVLDEKEKIYKILNDKNGTESIGVHIGTENDIQQIKDCSLITATYSIGNIVLGTIGVIGPTRMEYAKVISSMNFLKRKLNEEILKYIGDIDDS